MKKRSLVLKPLVAAALLCAGAAYAAPPANSLVTSLTGARTSSAGLGSIMQSGNGLGSALSGSTTGTMNGLNLSVTLGSVTNSLSGAGSSLPGLGQPGKGSLNPFAQNGPIHDNALGHAVFNTVNDVRRATNPPGLIPLNADRPDLPGLRKDATSDLVHTLHLYEGTERVLSLVGANQDASLNVPLTGAALTRPVQQLRQAARDASDRNDDHDNGFLGVDNSSTLGTDEGSDNDSGFLGAGDSSTLGTDNDRDPGDNGFLGIGDSSTLGTD
jgi:hypothetical protein